MQALQEAQQRFNDLVNSDWPERVPVDALEDYDPAFMKEGFLQKKGQRLKGWKRRWFVCDGRALSYYISRKDRKPNAVIPLEGCTVQDGGISETWNSPRIYLTDGATGVMYCLSAEDGTAVTQWLAVLRNAVARVNGELEDGQLADGGANGRARGGDDGRPNYTRSVSIDSKATNVGGGAAAPGPRTTTLRSAVSAGAAETKRTARLASAPPTSSGPTTSASAGVSASAAVSGAGANASTVASRPHRGKTQHVATSVALENELSSGLDLLDVLLAGRHTLSSRSPVAFRPISARDGVLRSVGVDSRTGKTVARASVVLPVASEIAAFLITDHSRRGEWDVHFPVAAHVASFDDATDLVYLAAPSAQVTSTRPFVAPPAAAAIGALGAALLVYTTSTWPELLTTMAIAGALGALVNALDLAALTAPRDLLLLRHVRETATKDDVPNEGDELGQSVVTILEKSVVNELKPAVSSVVRAHVSLSGWRLEPVDGTRTVATFVTEVDLKGWVSPTTSAQFAIERLEAVDVLREFVSQAQLRGGAALGFDEEGSTMGRDDRAVTELTDDEFGGDGELEEGLAEGGEGHHSFHPRVYIRGMMEMPTGGLKLVDKEIAKKQGGVVKDVIKSFGAKILEGKSAVSLSLPVRIFEPRTNLERLCDLMLYAPTYLNRAADSSDPVERLKLVIAFAVAGLHHSVGQLKPFNPILGETYQTTLNDGTDVCCEHTSHHPPISNFQLTGNKYSLAGYVLWHGSFSMKSNAVINSNRGPIRVSFGDGTTVQYNLPYLQLGGMLWGDRTVEIMGPMLFEDKKHHLMCELKLNPDAKQGMGGMFSTPKTPSDHFRGAIINTQTGAEICDVSGSWLHDVRCGGQQYWSIKRDKSGFLVPYPEAKLLPSDSRFREDRKFLDEGDLDESQEWKVRLEVLQRADRKIRIDGRRPNHWSFKDGAGAGAGGAH